MAKLLCSDFDHTIFFRDNETLTNQNYAAIKNWRTTGNLCAVSTNRSFASLKRQLPNYQDYFDYLILDSGSVVAYPNGEIIWQTFFDPKIIEALQNLAAALPEEPIITYSDAESEDYGFHPSSKTTKIRFWFKDSDIAKRALALIHKINRKSGITNSYVTDPKSRLYGCKAFNDIIPETSGKNIGVSKLANKLNIAHQDIITVGDGSNDREMIEDFDGYAIAGSSLATKHPELKTIPSLTELITNYL